MPRNAQIKIVNTEKANYDLDAGPDAKSIKF